jgi:hypothetical protein
MLVGIVPLEFTYAALRKAETIGRPVGSVAWLEDIVAKTGRQLLPAKRGPKPKVFRGFRTCCLIDCFIALLSFSSLPDHQRLSSRSANGFGAFAKADRSRFLQALDEALVRME